MEGPGKRLKKPGQSTSKALKRTHNGCSRLFVAVRGSASCACLYVLARGSSRLFVVTRAVMWLLVAVCGCMWVSVAVRTCGRWFLLSGPVLDPVFGPHLGTGKRTPKRRAADSNPQYGLFWPVLARFIYSRLLPVLGLIWGRKTVPVLGPRKQAVGALGNRTPCRCFPQWPLWRRCVADARRTRDRARVVCRTCSYGGFLWTPTAAAARSGARAS